MAYIPMNWVAGLPSSFSLALICTVDSHSLLMLPLNWIDMESLDKLWNQAGPQNHLFFINYYGLSAAHQLTFMSIMPPLHFENEDTSPSKLNKEIIVNMTP